ncbi:YbaY family lipoprotein [Candidatus Sodalis pierantonius]|uniref:YbaY family lipoprotein n=1 Tax=Candidatus Sodalis pierantonii TaxID=1486991 RepID=UPI00046CF82F|nr:YbaY family lipoprotein [Candidatus Sodalis pierantonius]
MYRVWQIIAGVALGTTLAGCADKSANIPTPAFKAPGTAQQGAISQPAVSGTVYIRQRIALPPNAALTVTLSDATIPDTPSKVIAQRVVRTDGKQAPFSFVLPFNPSDIQPNGRILLSAAITVDGRVVMITEQVKMAVTQGGARHDLILVPVESVALPTQTQPATTVPLSSPTQVTPSDSIPAPTSF